MKTLILCISIFTAGCSSIPTGNIRKVDGKKLVEVQKTAGPVKLWKAWEVQQSKTSETMKAMQAPAKALNYLLIPGFVISLALTLVSQCPTIQKRFLTVAMVCGAALPVCWSIMFVTSSPLAMLPVIIVMSLLAYYAFRKHGLIFSSSSVEVPTHG